MIAFCNHGCCGAKPQTAQPHEQRSNKNTDDLEVEKELAQLSALSDASFFHARAVS